MKNHLPIVFAIAVPISVACATHPPEPGASHPSGAAPVVASTAATTACAPDQDWDGSRCVARTAPEVATSEPECPAGSSAKQGECVVDEPKAEASSEPAPDVSAPSMAPPAWTSARDPRTFAQKPRALALLVTELEGLERLYRATPKNAPDRVRLMHRLAEDYDELEYASTRAKRANVTSASRRKALKYYLAIRAEYPNYLHLDQVLYYAGYAYERAHDGPNARRIYRELQRRFPGSPYAAHVPRR